MRVDLGDHPPRPPKDPDVAVEEASGSSSHDFATPLTEPWITRAREIDNASPGGEIVATLAAGKEAVCRAAANTPHFASVNYASDGSRTMPAIVVQDGTLQSCQPYR